MQVSDHVLFYLNGQRRTVSTDVALSSVLTYLRLNERLTGAKLGCGEGGCGACTVLLSTYDHHSKRVIHRSVNACLVPLAFVDGGAITTIEAVGDRQGGLAPVQKALIDMHGSQCGFCTPGIVMSMFALLRQRAAEGKQISEEDVEANFDGNLCRCTGYRPILDAFKGLVRSENEQNESQCLMGDQCCKRTGTVTNAIPEDSHGVAAGAQENGNSMDHGNSKAVVDREYIFPPELITYIPLELSIAKHRWLRPVTLDRFVQLRMKHPEAKIIVGNTELGVEARFKGLKIDTFLCASHIPELLRITETEHGLRIGASVTWTQLNSYIDDALAASNSASHDEPDTYKYGSLEAISAQLRWFAGKQIRNVATVSGNIVTASPISDVNPIWIAAGAEFVLLDCRTGKERRVPARDFFTAYRTVDMSEDEIFFYVSLPWNKSPYDITHAFKTSRRHEDDIAIVSAGIRIRLQQEATYVLNDNDCTDAGLKFRITHIAIGCGGLAPRTIAMDVVERSLQGQIFNEKTLQKGLSVMSESVRLPRDVPGGMPEYRQSLAVSFLFKAFVLTAQRVDKHCMQSGIFSAPRSLTGLGLEANDSYFTDFQNHTVSRGIQISSDRKPQFRGDYTGRSVKHVSAALQVSGEAKYLDDIAPFHKELQAALVMSTEAHAKIVSIQSEDASQMPGVHRIVTASDVRGVNEFGAIVADELCFAGKEVTAVGQVIGVVLAETLEQAKAAAKLVIVSYERLPAIVTIEDAIHVGSFAPDVPEHVIRKGNVDEVFQKAKDKNQIVEGTVRIGAQEHWYLEPQGTIAVPEENGEMTILSSTQNASETQLVVAAVLGEPMHKILCKVKRLGGAFGGKETRSLFISAAVAVAAQVTGRPARLVLDRDVDMLTTGTRHAFLAKYRAAYEPSGKIMALDAKIYNNMGNSRDLSISVLDRALFHAVNCYDIPHVNLTGRSCYTHTASNTAFRGFGGPQGMMIAENIVEHVAWAADLSPTSVRDINLFGKEGNSAITHFGMSFNEDPLVRCWDTVLADSEFDEREKAIVEFNKRNKFRKRGISAVPTMFGVSFTFRTLNQAGALVHIFHGDGSVLVSHGGVEMGQGLHTKMCQITATELGIPIDKVFISETATDKIANASPTAASSSSDMYGMAVKRACEKLNANLKPFKAELGENAPWEEIVHNAWFNRVNLSATGFYRTPELDQMDLSDPTCKGNPYYYFTNGAAVSEVEVDLLTGESMMLRTDIAMDVGRPLNPAIDIGQIEGAFIQGVGWCTMEEVVRGSSQAHKWLKTGHTHTLGPGTYKLPGFADIPKDFRVRVLNTENEKDTIYSSKAIGEPPLFLAASVFFAIRRAVGASRLENGYKEWFELDSPATVERIKMTAGFSPCHMEPMDENFRAHLSL
eukprot:GFKZ01005647.1.p1 GENE.GFKZ01005647.1~~GFKZ01005647.1.p1  ORF type:complete len:1395 (+),score=186.86 GFKZ01005647.1:345-4529(+)